MNAYEFHPEARLDLEEIWGFIGADNLNAADSVLAEILDAVRAVALFPHQGFRRPNITSRALRFKPVREYLIVYAPDAKPLRVVAIIHGRRSPRVLAALLRGREE